MVIKLFFILYNKIINEFKYKNKHIVKHIVSKSNNKN